MSTSGDRRLAARGGRGALLLAGLAALLLAGLLLLPGCERKPQEQELRIGLLIPLTNTPDRFIAHRAAEQYVSRINAAGGVDTPSGKARVRLFVEDTGNQIERVMNAANRLIQVDRVAAMVGPYYSREATPVGAVAEAAQVVMLTPTASSPEVTRGRGYVFRACLVDTDQAQAMASCAVKDMRLATAAVLYEAGDAYSRGLAGYFRDFFTSLGGRVVLFEGHPPDARDFTGAMGRVRASGASLLYLPNYSHYLKLQVVQARAAGFSGVFMGADSWDGDRSLHTIPEAEGAVFTADFFPGGLGEKARSELDSYAAVLGEPLDKDSVLTLDSLALILAAAGKAQSLAPRDLREGLLALRGFEGLTGRISFRANGDTDRSVHVLKVAGGRTELLKVVNQGQQ